MSAEVSFTKRAAAELSRCFNGLTVNRSTGSAGSTTKKSTSSSTASSGPSTSSSLTSTSSGSSASSSPFYQESRQSSTTSSTSTRPPSETTSLLPSNPNNSNNDSHISQPFPRSNPFFGGNKGQPTGKSTSSKSGQAITMKDGITITNSVQSLINKANTTLSPFKESLKASVSSSSSKTPSTPSRRNPPPAPRKTSIARRKNYFLNLQKPSTLGQLIKDFSFLHNFFGYFSPKERTVLAQVCVYWRDILYNDKDFWRNLRMVINCNDLRRLSPLPVVPSTSSKILLGSTSSASSTDPTNNNNNNSNNSINEIAPNVTYSSVRRKSSPMEDSARYSLYLSIEQREIDSIVLYGATDADIIDFASKISPSAMKKISSAALKSSSASDKGLEIFLAAFNLSLLHLQLTGCNEISDSALWTGLIPNLESLVVTDCINIADETVASISQVLSNLKSLTFQAYHVTDSAMSYFGPTAARLNLRVLQLEHCWEIGNQGVLSIAHGLPNLTSLSLSGCSKVTDDAIEVIAEQLRHLTSLNLSWCARITDASLEYIACDLSDTLKELNLDRCIHVTDIGLGYAATMSRLTTLSIRWCPQIRDFGIQTLCSMKSLKSLAVAGCPQLTVSGLSCLAQMSQLSEIELTNCPGASSELLNFLTNHLPSSTVILS